MDRFYPTGMQSDPDVWKTSYEMQNEMQTSERSPYPPGCAVHLPGAREQFGFGSPGPNYGRTARSGFAIIEDADAYATDESREMMQPVRPPSQMAQAGSQMLMSAPSMMKSSSSPALRTHKRLSDTRKSVTRFEDEKHSFFVPNSLRNASVDRIQGNFALPKLNKEQKVVMSFGDGTGFRSQGALADWWPQQNKYGPDMPTSYRISHQPPPFRSTFG